MKRNPHAWVDIRTRAVLRVDSFRERLKPASEIGRSRSLVVLEKGPEAWRLERSRLDDLERWYAQVDVSELMRHLGECPTIDEVIRKLRSDVALDEPLLFRLKRLIYHAESIAALEPPHVEIPVETLSELRETLHPQAKPGPRFRLVDELDEALARARKVERKARKRLREITGELEAQVVERLDGRFDIRGIFKTDDEIPQDLPLSESPEGWKLSSPALEEARSAHLDAREDVETHQSRVMTDLSKTLASSIDVLVALEEQMGHLDLRVARVRLRREIDGCWPELDDEVRLDLEDARAPDIEDAQAISFVLDDAPVLLLGPNMGGKSALLRLVGLAVYCAHHLIPFPAKKLHFGWASALVYIGSDEPNAPSLTKGLSAFGREVRRVVDCLELPERAVWLLDEVGRGTHPRDGAHILEELVKRLAFRGDAVVATTHFSQVSIPGNYYRIRGIQDRERLEEALRSGGDETRLLQTHMDYQPEAVDADAEPPRDALLVARALGLDLD